MENLDEPVLPDDYRIHASYLYKVVRSDWHYITAGEFKKREGITELRGCDLIGRGVNMSSFDTSRYEVTYTRANIPNRYVLDNVGTTKEARALARFVDRHAVWCNPVIVDRKYDRVISQRDPWFPEGRFGEPLVHSVLALLGVMAVLFAIALW